MGERFVRRGRAADGGAAGLTLIELLIGVAIVGILAGVGIPTYLGIVQRARETVIITYLGALHKAQQAWRLETGSPGYTGDFAELEESGFLTSSAELGRVRTRSPRRGGTRTNSSREFREYRLDLVARDNPSTDTYTYTVKRTQRIGSGPCAGSTWIRPA